MNSINFARFLFLLVILGLSVQSSAQHASDSLESAEIMRPNDFIKQEPRWNRASTDLYTYMLDSGLYGYYGPQPKLLLDGIPIDVDYFGWQNLNALPLFVDNIERVTSRFTPQTYSNTLASAGLINFKTAPPDTGLHVSSSFYMGNESGDPGPFMYDSLKTTPNIDRWGPDGSLLLSYRKDNWYAKGLYSFRNHQQTDLISNQRIHITASVLGTNPEYVNYKIQTVTQSGLFETGFQSDRWDFKVRGIYGKDKNYLFLQPFGREMPTNTMYKQLAVQGTFRPGDWEIKGRYLTHNKKIGKRFDLHPYIFDWDQTTHTFSTSAEYKRQNFGLKPSVIYERINTQTRGVAHPFNDLATFSLDGWASLSSSLDFNFHASVDYDEEQFAKTFKLNTPVLLTDFWKVTPEFFYTELLPLRQNSFAYWVGRGYTFADELGISIDQPLESFTNKLTGAKLSNEFSIFRNLNISFEQKLIHHDAINIPWQIVEENEFLDTLPGIFTATSEEGTRISLLAQIDNTIADLIRQKFTVHIQRTLSGSKRYKDYFQQIPQTKIDYQLDVFPTPDLTLSLQTTHISSAMWNEFAALEGVEYILPSGIPIRRFSGTFHTQTPSFTNVTLSIRKQFLNDHINTQFSVQNLLNQEVRRHTLGAELFTKFNMKIGIKL